MWVIVEIYNGAILCYPAGDIMLWRNREAAGLYAEAVSARNEGVYSVQHLWADAEDSDAKWTHGYRLSSDKRDPLKITGAFPLSQTMFTKYMD